ncbi:thioredoxin [Butyricicoccus sp. 1XD8-22]|nr:thioredoxin [Butyricicoccus sp. 1XD8-22]
MAILDLNTNNFQSELENARVPVLVDFWAESCPHCIAMNPRLETIDRESEGRAKLCKVNVDEQPQLAARFGITSIPTMLFFRSGALTGRMVGARETQDLREALGL